MHSAHQFLIHCGGRDQWVAVGLTHFPLLYFSEIEAKEACDWLRAAGFPQYAQLYEGKLGFSSLFIKRINSKYVLWCVLTSKSFSTIFPPCLHLCNAQGLSWCQFRNEACFLSLPHLGPLPASPFFTSCFALSASHLYRRSQLCLFLPVFCQQQLFCTSFLIPFCVFSSHSVFLKVQ